LVPLEPPNRFDLTAKDAKEMQGMLEPQMNANKNNLRLSAFIGGSKFFLFSSVVPAVPSWFNSSPHFLGEPWRPWRLIF
jgi:hypothetical protein